MADIAQHIATNFPSPEDGDRFTWGGVRYTYDASPGIWTGAIPEIEATITVTTGDTAPANPEEGNLWFCCDDDNSNNARLYVYVAGNWIDTNPDAPESADDGPTPPDTSVTVSDDGTPLFTGTDVLRVLNLTGSAITSISDRGGGEALITIDKADTPDLPALPSGTDTVPHVLDIPPAGQGDPEWVPISDGAVSLAALSDTNIDPTSITTNHVLGWDGSIWTPREDENTDTLEDLTDTNISGAADGDMLTLRGDSWVAEQLSDNLSATHSSITIDTDTTDLSVPTGLSLSGTELRLTRGGGQSVLSADLSSISGGGSTPVTIDVIGGATTVENAATLNFTGNVTVSTPSSGSTTANITIDRPTFDIEDGSGSTVANGDDVALDTIIFADNLTATVSGSELTVRAAGGSGGGSGTVNQVDSISNPTQIISADNLTSVGAGNTARLYSSLEVASDSSFITDAATLDVIDGLRTEESGTTTDTHGQAMNTASLSLDMNIQNNGTSVNGSDPLHTLNFSDNITARVVDNTATLTVPSNPSVSDEGSLRTVSATNINFVGDGVTVTNRSGNVAEVNIPASGGSGGGSSSSDEAQFLNATTFQTVFDRSDRRFFLHGDSVAGSKHYVVFKNNSATNVHSIYYEFGEPGFTTHGANIGSGRIWGSRSFGIWDHEQGEFSMMTAGAGQNGLSLWRPGAGSALRVLPDSQDAARGREVIEMEVYVKPGGRVDFTISNRELLWMLSSIPIRAPDP